MTTKRIHGITQDDRISKISDLRLVNKIMALDHRIRMHTESLQKAFPEVYRDFFAKCSTVVSAPGSFFWSAGLAVVYGGVGVLQKLPLRVYVGIERDGGGDIKFGNYVSYIPHQQQFENFYHDESYEKKFGDLLKDFRKNLPGRVGGIIHVLSEVPWGAGLNQSGASNMAISVLLALESGLIDSEKLSELVVSITPGVLEDKIFDVIFRFAWKLEAFSHSNIGTASAPFTSFIDSNSPIIFFSECRKGVYDNHPKSRFPADVDGHYEVFDQIKYRGYRLKDFLGWRANLDWPIDYGLVYLGRQKHSNTFLCPMHAVQESLKKLENFADDYFGEFVGEKGEKILPAFRYMTENGEGVGYKGCGIDFLSILSVKAINDLKTLMENGTAESLDELCNTVQLQEKIYEFFTKGLPSSGEKDVLARIKQALLSKGANGLKSMRFLPDRPDGGGDLLFVAPKGYLQDHLDEFLTILKTNISPLVRIDYASWIEGGETGGIRIEQNISRGDFSRFTSEGVLNVIEWNGKSTESIQKIYPFDAFSIMKGKVDLFLDEIQQKIYVKGECLTSKDIKSSKATIEILKVLLNNYGQEVKAINLPVSTYINRNEMQSKIITPLVHSFKRITGKNLSLSLQGGLRKNFSMKLEPSGVSITFLEKKL